MIANRFKPTLLELPQRLLPAVLLHVTAAQQQTIHDATGFDGVADVGETIQLPASAGPKLALLIPLPIQQQGFLPGYNNALLAVEDGIVTEAWWGVDEKLAQAFADEHGLALWAVVADLDAPSQLMAGAELVDLLQVAEVNQPMQGDWLAAQFQSHPASLAVPDADGVLTLKLAVSTPEGFRVATLQHSGPLFDLWTLTKVETVGALPTEAGLYQLKVV